MLDKLLRTEVLDKDLLLDGLDDRGRWPGRYPASVAVSLAVGAAACGAGPIWNALYTTALTGLSVSA